MNESSTTDLILDADGQSLNLTNITADGLTYFMAPEIIKIQLESNASEIFLYDDFPAIRAELKGSIIEIENNEIKTYNDFDKIMKNYKPGDEINLKTNYNENNGDLDNLSYYNSFIVGIFQSFALFPGISRSGSTRLALIRSISFSGSSTCSTTLFS